MSASPSGAALVNPAARVRIERHGHERQPVVVIDDVLADPQRWLAEAERARFEPIGPFYPGVRAVVPGAIAAALRERLAGLIGEVFALDPVPPVHECYWSLVTTQPDRLAPIQRLPHFDGVEASRIAILIYLSRAELGGTAFYRQRATGFETIDAGRFAAFEQALQHGVAAHGLPPAAYVGGDTPIYERIAVYDARPNRALIYRGHTLHCAAIPPGATLSADPRDGRLSVNTFLFDPGALRGSG